MQTFYWHDYETFGADTRRDRPAQFAGQRTTLDLEPIGDPLVLYCQPPRDVFPHPQASLLTGITPQLTLREGVSEREFAARVIEELAVPETCVAGYNSIRFDDEVTRHLLYRNFYEPYAREWENGNSRWDLIDLLRMCYALRPAGIEWPNREDGTPSFRLEDLSRANSLDHSRAHDALSDVHATLGLARLLRREQNKLFHFFFDLRRKQCAFGYLDYAHLAPVLHISARYPATRGCLAMVVPLALHPNQSNAVIVYDLDVDPSALIELSAEEIAERVFTARADLPEDIARIPLKLVHANRSPALAPLSVLKGVDLQRIQLDPERAQRHLLQLKQSTDIVEKVRRVFAQTRDDAAIDPELALYAGFLPDADKRLLRDVRQCPPEQLAQRAFAFRDKRYPELLFRYRARNFPNTLTADEHARWEAFRLDRLTRSTPLTTLNYEQYSAEIARQRADPMLSPDKMAILDALDVWGHTLLASA